MPAAFRFEQYQPSYVGDIARVMGLPAQLQAQAAQARAEAIARNNAAHAAAAGQTGAALNQAGQQIVGNLGDVMALKRDAPVRALQLEALKQQVEQGGQKLLTEQEARKAHADTVAAFQDGLLPDGGYDLAKVQSSLVKRGQPEAAMEVRKQAESEGGDWSVSDGILYNKKSGKSSVVKAPTPTTASLAVDANTPDSPTAGTSKAALATIQAPQEETARHNREMERISSLTAGRAAATAAETTRHNRAVEAAANPLAALQGANGSMTGTAQAAQQAQGATGEDFLKQLPPQIASEVKAYAEGRRPFPAGFALKSPYFQSLIQMVGQYDPTFDAANYNARSKARTDLTNPNGMGGKTINALNTAIQHAGKLSDLIETLGNTEYPLVNALANPVKTAFGSTKVTNFKAVAPQLAKEIQKAWVGAGGASKDINDLIDSIGKNLGRQQQREALKQFVELAEGKLSTTQTQRDAVLGPAGASIPIIFNQSLPILEKIKTRASTTGMPSDNPQQAAVPADGTLGTVNGQPAVWKTVDGKAGWYAR